MPWPRRVRAIDLSLPIQNNSLAPQEQEIIRWDHREFARGWAKRRNLDPGLLPEPYIHAAQEVVKASTHAGTHMDAPWNFGPTSEGKPSKTIDQIPLEWCFGDGVVLDVTHRKKGEEITVEDLKAALAKLNYTIKPGDIVLIRTGADKNWNTLEYANSSPGMGKAGIHWLLDQGVKVMGIDAWGFDIPIHLMVEALKRGEVDRFFPTHYAGREKEYCHVETMCNLDKVPPLGSKICLFPIKVDRAGGGWVRAVALVEEE